MSEDWLPSSVKGAPGFTVISWGVMAATGPLKLKPGNVVVMPPPVTTVRSTVPGFSGGTITVSCVGLTKVTFEEATLPNMTLVLASKLAPVMVTETPPVEGAVVMERPWMLGEPPAARPAKARR